MRRMIEPLGSLGLRFIAAIIPRRLLPGGSSLFCVSGILRVTRCFLRKAFPVVIAHVCIGKSVMQDQKWERRTGRFIWMFNENSPSLCVPNI